MKQRQNKFRQFFLLTILLSFTLWLPAISLASDITLSVEVMPAPTINDFDFSFNNNGGKIMGEETKNRSDVKILEIIKSVPMLPAPLKLLNYLPADLLLGS